jgi:DNA invertase Pin-like site-specific DNA recombinase
MTVAKYLRLSAEDADLRQSGREESNSIANQRNLLDAFIERTPDLSGAKILEFCDDGWSGKSFDRPAIKELLEQTKQGLIHCIIVKDMSRFGRDYLTVGNYISRVFPFLGVRFIAVNDGVDSIRPKDIDSLDTSFKALLYDLYSRDLSRKTRSARRFRAQKGEYLGARPLYGYVKDPERKNHLIIDPPAAEIVRRIFAMVGGGMSIAETAKELNQQQIPTPMQDKTAKGMYASWNCIGEVNFWTEGMVLKMIRDEQYTGSTVYGRRYYDIIGQSHSVKVSKKDWIIVPDVHEPIVSREDFDRAQAALKEYKERHVVAGPKTKIRCGGCGHAMERKKAKEPYFICRTPGVTDRFPCPREKIPEQEIHVALLDGLRSMAQMAVDMDKLLREQQKEKTRDCAALRRNLTSLQEQLSQLKRQTKSQYEAFALGEVGKEAYLAAKASLRQKEETLSEQIAKLELSIEQTQLTDSNADGLAVRLQSYLDVEQLTEDILGGLVEQVLVFPDGRLEIRWEFRDELERLRKMALG